jgi:hypothetical protein
MTQKSNIPSTRLNFQPSSNVVVVVADVVVVVVVGGGVVGAEGGLCTVSHCPEQVHRCP